MAIVVRDSRNRSPFWYACYTTADGRRLKKSTKESNQTKAKLLHLPITKDRTIKSCQELLKALAAWRLIRHFRHANKGLNKAIQAATEYTQTVPRKMGKRCDTLYEDPRDWFAAKKKVETFLKSKFGQPKGAGPKKNLGA